MDTTTTTTEVVQPSITIHELEPYFMDIHNNFNASNGLLLFLVIYLVIKDVGRFIYKFIFGGNI